MSEAICIAIVVGKVAVSITVVVIVVVIYSGTSDVERNSFQKSCLQLICSEVETIFPIRNK